MGGGGQVESTASYRMLRELGARAQRTFAAIREPHELLVVQRFTGNGSAMHEARYVTAEQTAQLRRDGASLAKNWHPNLARVKHVDVIADELWIATELVDGVTLEDMFEASRARRSRALPDNILPPPILTRVLLDILAGLGVLHGLREGVKAPLGAFHGELCPANVVVGKDGVARVINVLRPRPLKIEALSEAVAYAPPETLAGELAQDARADLYAVGAMLWEGLSGRRLYEEADPTRVAARQREEDLPPPEIDPSAPLAPLAEVTLAAMSFDRALRPKSAPEMASAMRRLAGKALAPGSAVAQAVMDLAGDRIRARRLELDAAVAGARRRGSSLPAAPRASAPDGSAAEIAPSAESTLELSPIGPDDLGDLDDAPVTMRGTEQALEAARVQSIAAVEAAPPPRSTRAPLPRPSSPPPRAPSTPSAPAELETRSSKSVIPSAPPKIVVSELEDADDDPEADAEALAAAMEVVVSSRSLVVPGATPTSQPSMPVAAVAGPAGAAFPPAAAPFVGVPAPATVEHAPLHEAAAPSATTSLFPPGRKRVVTIVAIAVVVTTVIALATLVVTTLGSNDSANRSPGSGPSASPVSTAIPTISAPPR